jgi:hypothetical protein
MSGFWMSRPNPQAKMRVSDGRLRQKVCVMALTKHGGKNLNQAAAEVAAYLGLQSVGEVETVRTGLYETKVGHEFGQFVSQFLSWRNWVITSDKMTLKLCLADYRKEYGEPRGERLRNLISKLRNKSDQRLRNNEWRLEPGVPAQNRIDRNHWSMPSEWMYLATDLWSLGRLHAKVGEKAQAKALLARALELWLTYGHELAHRQEDALPLLKLELAKLD